MGSISIETAVCVCKRVRQKDNKKKEKTFLGKFEGGRLSVTSTLPVSFKMNTFAYQVLYPSAVPMALQTNLDWMELPWGGPYGEDEEDIPIALCGECSCPGNCDICVVAEMAIQRVFLPIQGPVNRDGVPLGYLLMSP
jgi:hypothetical protein